VTWPTTGPEFWAQVLPMTAREQEIAGAVQSLATHKVTMHYDNSTANRFNPDPTATVRWGDQTWEEMMLGYYGTIELAGSTATRQR